MPHIAPNRKTGSSVEALKEEKYPQKSGNSMALMVHGRISQETVPPTDHMVSHDQCLTFLNGA
ncbi:hypothetical protein D3C72_2268740 [compost metagenome]